MHDPLGWWSEWHAQWGHLPGGLLNLRFRVSKLYFCSLYGSAKVLQHPT